MGSSHRTATYSSESPGISGSRCLLACSSSSDRRLARRSGRRLVSPLVLYDRQEYDLNWWSVTNVLIASPAGQVAEIPLIALVASLASVRRPEDLGLVLLARPHILPAELGNLPHALVDPVDSSDPAGVERTLMSVRQELDRRVAAGAREDGCCRT